MRAAKLGRGERRSVRVDVRRRRGPRPPHCSRPHGAGSELLRSDYEDHQTAQTDRQTPGTAAERSAGNNNTAASHGREAETGKTGPGKAVGLVCSRVFELELMTLCGLFKGQSSRSHDKKYTSVIYVSTSQKCGVSCAKVVGATLSDGFL